MSLTSFVSIPEVRRRFRDEFPSPPFPSGDKPAAPPLTSRHRLVATAFDYLLRFYVKRLNPDAKTSRWTVDRMPNVLASKVFLAQTSRRAPRVQQALEMRYSDTERILSEANEAYARYLNAGRIDARLLRSVVSLAQIDPFYESTQGEYVRQRISQRDIRDLRALISLVDRELFKAKKVAVINPTFRFYIYGGAVADLLIDDLLIEINTTAELKVRRHYYNQLLGYYTLAALDGIEGLRRQHRIQRLGIYFSRFGKLWLVNVKDVVNPNSFPAFAKWFEATAYEEGRWDGL